MIKLLINGISGRMGQEVYRAACENENIEVVAGVDKVGSDLSPLHINLV